MIEMRRYYKLMLLVWKSITEMFGVMRVNNDKEVHLPNEIAPIASFEGALWVRAARVAIPINGAAGRHKQTL